MIDNVWIERAYNHNQNMLKNYADEITQSVNSTKLYDEKIRPPKPVILNEQTKTSIIFEQMFVEDVIDKYRDDKCCILNFASYKQPGGGYMTGSTAQEEMICHISNLYEILCEHKDYYEYNKKHLNHGLYHNRALYIPNVYVQTDTDLSHYIDIITCAAPNVKTAYRFWDNMSLEVERTYMEDRWNFILDIFAENNNRVHTLIVGAWGTGVFGISSQICAQSFVKALKSRHRDIPQIIMAIPDKKIEIFKKEIFNAFPLKDWSVI